ncbi:MAG: hypothetical protein IJF73_05330 [Clostridia bacterium]|nr:hypothetical protein [Clostridia bacterium]
MDTVKIERGNCRMIAHRGASALEAENTVAAFVAAANRSYWGIETDVRVTKDGKYAISHDDTLTRMAGVELKVEEATLAELQAVRLFDKTGKTRSDLVVPTLEDYISVCHRYGKRSVLELKGDIAPEHVAGILDVIESAGHFEDTVFISFRPQNLLNVKKLRPMAEAQLLPSENAEWVMKYCLENRIGLDIHHTYLTPEIVEMVHKAGLLVNCWTVDTPAYAARAIGMGVDFITTNTLE